MQGRPIRLAALTTGAVELVLANEVVDELSDMDDRVGGLVPDGFGMERTPILLLGATAMPLVRFVQYNTVESKVRSSRFISDHFFHTQANKHHLAFTLAKHPFI